MYRSNDEWIKRLPIGPGWHKIVETLDSLISQIEPNYQIVQIKNKLGGLRFYIDFSRIDDEKSQTITKLINKAEEESHFICEECGNSRELNRKGYNTLCKNCRRSGP